MKRITIPLLVLVCLLLPAHSTAAPLDVPAWQSLAGPNGGSVTTLAMSPHYAIDHTVFAGLRAGGVYRTTSSGDSWQAMSPADWIVIDLAISPDYAADKTIFAAEGLGTIGFKLHRSSDEGVTWQSPAATPYAYGFQSIERLAISSDFAHDQTLFALGSTETYSSTDGGVTWSIAGGWFASHDVIDLVFSPNYASDQTLFAIVAGDAIYTSTDGGSIWNPTGLTGDFDELAISPNYASDQTLAAVSATDGQVYFSLDGGATWPPNAIVLGTGGKHTLLFSLTYATDQRVLAASSTDAGVYRSVNSGASWTQVGVYNPAMPYQGGFIGGGVQALTVAPDNGLDSNSFAGTNAGLYRSNNAGENWYQNNNGLPRLTVRSIAIAPNDPQTILAGTSYFNHVRFDSSDQIESDGTLQLSTNGGATWQIVSGELDRVQRVAFATNQVAFATTGLVGQHGYANGSVQRSIDDGHTWSTVLSNTVSSALAASPNYTNDHTLWVSSSGRPLGSGLLVSTNGGDNWALLAASIHAQVLAASPNYAVDQTLLAGTPDSGLQKSINGGLNWSQVLTSSITSLAVSPAYGASQTIYAGVHESSDAAGEIYRSIDGGASWQKLSTGIPATYLNQTATIASLVFAADGSVIAGVAYGNSGAAYRSIDGGDTWQVIADGLSDTNLFDLASNKQSSEIDPHISLSFYAGTDSGLWSFGFLQHDVTEPGTWLTHGPYAGRAQALAVSPNFQNDGFVLAGGWIEGRYGDQSGPGIFKSMNSGDSWQASATGLVAPYYYQLAIHGFGFSPNFVSDTTVFAATWGGLFKSTDGGTNWQWLSRATQGAPGSFSSVAPAPDYSTSGVVMATSGWAGLFVSRDFGVNWQPNYSVSAYRLAYSPDFATDGTAFAGGFGVYSTTDRGLTWTQVISDYVSALIVSPDYTNDRSIFAGSNALYISNDGGATWITHSLSISATYISALAASPQFSIDHTLFAGTNDGLYRSDDAGLNWSKVTAYSGPGIAALAISPNWPAQPVLLVGTTRGVYRTLDGGSTWQKTPGFQPIQPTELTLSNDDSLLITGAINDGLYASSDLGNSWSPIGLQNNDFYFSTSHAAISPDYSNDHTLFAAWNSGVSIGGNIYRTTDSGANWQRVAGSGNIGSIVMSPNYANDHTLFAAAYSLHVISSTNGGDSWSPIGTWPADVYFYAARLALPPNYPDDQTVFAGGGGFWRLPPGESMWQPATSGLLSDTYVIEFAVSPHYAVDHTLLAVAASNSYQQFAVYRSTDGGLNWQPSNIGLPNVELKDVAFSPNFAIDHTAYATSIGHLYRSSDGGLRWTDLGAPPDWPSLSYLAVDHAGRVYVSTSAGVMRYTTNARDILIDGRFEAGNGWDLPSTPASAAYTQRIAYDDMQSMRIGIDNGSNGYAYSSARQTVTLPGNLTSAQLSFRAYLVSGEPPLTSVNAAPKNFSSELPVVVDAQYLAVINPATGAISQTLFSTRSNAQAWQSYSFDLSAYAGQTIRLHFGVSNDGLGGETAMYIDNASLLITTAPLHKVYLPIVLSGF
jgi:photosystem II stability/assembly factor-like uncharacterized protein